jgi:hypothetical protein
VFGVCGEGWGGGGGGYAQRLWLGGKRGRTGGGHGELGADGAVAGAGGEVHHGEAALEVLRVERLGRERAGDRGLERDREGGRERDDDVINIMSQSGKRHNIYVIRTVMRETWVRYRFLSRFCRSPWSYIYM